MGRYDENTEEIATRTMTLFYLFDTSGSMSGEKIGQVNFAMKDIPDIITEISAGAPNANIAVAAASFDDEVKWLAPEPQQPEEFKKSWHQLTAGGCTNIGAALLELNEKMSRKGFLSENPMGYLKSGVIIMSDGEPSDDWKTPLARLNKNNWFKNAIKVAFAVGDEANKEVLAEICGSSEAVISIDNPDKIRNYIKFVTQTVSRTGTTGIADSNLTPQQAVNNQLQALNDDTPVVVDIPDIDDTQWD